MKTYIITPYNDMGHLMLRTTSGRIPDHINTFVYQKIKNKITKTTDNDGYGTRWYILKSGLADSWLYTLGEDAIVIDYSKLDKYNSKTMVNPEVNDNVDNVEGHRKIAA